MFSFISAASGRGLIGRGKIPVKAEPNAGAEILHQGKA
jgi:hypothetical protein